MKPVIVLPDPLMRQCQAFGQQVVDGYKTGMKSYSRSLARDGADTNVELQTMARVAECAVCLWARLDPLAALNWSQYPDAGYDLCLQNIRFDIKASQNGARYLIWPRSKNHLFETKPFDVMAFVRAHGERCELVGWTNKERFLTHHQVAPENHKLQPGTWFMDAGQLCPFDPDVWDTYE